MIHETLIDFISSILKKLYNADVDNESITIQNTCEYFEGDITVVLFPILKFSKKNPAETGEEIFNLLKEKFDFILSYSVVKGYLNLILSDRYWLHWLKKPNSRKTAKDKESKPVVVEFSSPNTNKPLHLGHIRNNLLGAAISSILEATGSRVVRVNLINDRGIHICKSMIGWIKFAKGSTPELSGVKGDKFVGNYYVEFEKAYKKELEYLEAKGLSKDEAEKKSNLMQEARAMLKHWEDGEPQTRSLWKQMNNWVYDGFDETYKRMGISFDKIYYESDTYLVGKSIINEGLNKGSVVQKSDGSVWIDLAEEGMDEKILLRSDGTSVYITQDIGTAVIRNKEFDPEEMIYVVGNEQDYHFQVLKSVIEKLGYNFAHKVKHLSYGMVTLPSGKMKSREGKVVDADDLMDEMKDTATKVTTELGKWSIDELTELDDIFEMLGQGALKYHILKVDPKKNILFNPKESIDFTGNTGPFIQYTHARISSLLKKAGSAGFNHCLESINESFQLEEAERNLLKTLYDWPAVLEEAAEELSPAVIANYCYDLAKNYNRFYQEHQVISADNETQRNLRLVMSDKTADTLRYAMGLLGITLPDRM